MSAQLLSVPISRFEPEKELACDIFLSLPLNRKTIRLVAAGQDFPRDLLERLKAKGHTELSVSWELDKGSDPTIYPLYIVGSTLIEPTVEPIPLTASPASPEAPLFPAPEPESVKAEAEAVFSQTKETESETRINGSPGELDSTERAFSADSPEAEAIQRFSSQPVAADNSSFTISGQKTAPDKSETRFSSSPIDPKEEEVIRRIAATSAKISERIQILAGANTEEASTEMATLLLALEATEAGEEIPADLAVSLAADSTPEKASSDEQERTASRELPATASRLAASLGVALGYSKVDFLADLGAAAVAHFARKQGSSLDETSLPEFAKAALENNLPPNSQLDDFKNIIGFLDAYLSDPECDRTLRDLDKRLFYKTLAVFEKDNEFIDPWSIKKWTCAVELGPTLESHSLCTKASARALKASKISGIES